MIFFLGKDATIKIGDRCTFNGKSRSNFRGINHPCILQADRGNIVIGNDCGFSGVSIVSSVDVRIGNNVMCGANVKIGDRNDHEDIYPQWQPKPVSIGDKVWIGMDSIVLRGVTIGNNVVIGAGSIVTKDIPDNVVAAGNPCRVIRAFVE
jgi:acetyltransferase-like isoleucine patch superfamily enzyme